MCNSEHTGQSALQVAFTSGLEQAAQQQQDKEEQETLAASAAIQPITANRFCDSDTAFARSQAFNQVADCLTALVSLHLSSADAGSTQRISNAIASMFTPAAIPRFATLTANEREAEIVHLADILVGAPWQLLAANPVLTICWYCCHPSSM